LTEGVEYVTQHSTSNNEERTIRPDVVVNLPGEKHLILDSKVSLTAYSSWVSAADDTERDAAVRMHVSSIRSHVKLLSEKNYPSGKKLNSPDFVILFTPIEAAFALAIQSDKELYSDAWEMNIIIVSPTTLLATLRTVSNIWMQERRINNVQAIAEEGGKLYDKFVAFMIDLKEIGAKIKGAGEAYDAAVNKLETGRGNIIARTQKMKRLGAKASKSLDIDRVEHAESEDENDTDQEI
jgi:DNA recombination protein RmuC